MIQPPRGFGENPVAIYHDPVLPPSHHYLAAYRWLDHEFGVDAVIHLGKHGTLEWLPGKGLGLSAHVRARCRAAGPAADLPVHRQRPGGGHPGQTAWPRGHRRPPGAAHGPRGQLRGAGQAGTAAGRVRHRGRAGPGQAAHGPGPDLVAWSAPPSCTTTWGWPASPARPSSTTSCCTSTATCARSRTPRSGTGCTSWARRRRGRPCSTWSWSSCVRPSCGAPAGVPCPACGPPWACWKAAMPPAPTPTATSRPPAP